MESIIGLLGEQRTWEQFLANRLLKGRLGWHAFEAADAFVAGECYRDVVRRLTNGEGLSVPVRHLVNKMGTGRKRVVYSYRDDEMTVLKALAWLLYRYDDRLPPNLYSFRRGLTAHDAVRRLMRDVGDRPMWAYKLDIHDYFNSIAVGLLLPQLRELLADEPLYRLLEQMLTDGRARWDGKVISEEHGVMAGTPTSPFLANVFLMEVDRHFADLGVTYARYSDDIILFAPTREELDRHIATLRQMLHDRRLVVNPDKVRIYRPGEAFDFLGFRCQGQTIDIAEATRRKMKGKIRRLARRLVRWRQRKGRTAEAAMRALASHFNRKFFECDDPEALSWSRWFFPLVNRTEGLRDIDRYLQHYLRHVATGHHRKANFRIRYSELRAVGYRSLVHEYWRWRHERP